MDKFFVGLIAIMMISLLITLPFIVWWAVIWLITTAFAIEITGFQMFAIVVLCGILSNILMKRG